MPKGWGKEKREKVIQRHRYMLEQIIDIANSIRSDDGGVVAALISLDTRSYNAPCEPMLQVLVFSKWVCSRKFFFKKSNLSLVSNLSIKTQRIG